ncbi:MAG: phosphate ABC transporter permease subunit PstC [Synergistaceae bacterium]|jgi:phosphate transport system permease protein|nr:phosphate ABC transporter permease subunit PstC [Synergistaceae bacterium]
MTDVTVKTQDRANPEEAAERRRSSLGLRESLPRVLVYATALSGIWLVAFIIFFLIKEGVPILSEASISEIAGGTLWYPASAPPLYGMLPLIAGSAAVTALSSILAIPFGVATALFLSEICPEWAREFCKVSLEILGFLPSVVLGFIGMVILAPMMQHKFELLTGLNMLNASFLLGVMILPTIASLSEDSLSAVPQSMRDASHALGATRFETMFKITLPCASRGIAQAAILGVMRSVGETMVVLMASGGAAIIPEFISDPVRPLTSTIAAEMGETAVGSAHYHALFFMGCMLLAFTCALNLLVMKIEGGRSAK